MTPPLKFGPKARKKNLGGFLIKKALHGQKKIFAGSRRPEFFFSGGFSVKKALYGQKKKIFAGSRRRNFFFGGSSVLDPGVGADPPAPPKNFFYDPPLTFFFMTPLAFWTSPTYGKAGSNDISYVNGEFSRLAPPKK